MWEYVSGQGTDSEGGVPQGAPAGQVEATLPTMRVNPQQTGRTLCGHEFRMGLKPQRDSPSSCLWAGEWAGGPGP